MSHVKLITNPDELIAHPEIYPFSLDAGQKRVTFIHVSRKRLQKAAFHDRSLVTSSSRKWAVSLDNLMAWEPLFASRILHQPRFIFHTSYCGSTLLSRAIDQPGKCVVYREPEIIYELRMLRHRIDTGDQSYLADWQCLFSSMMWLLGRSFATDEQVVVKLAAEDSYLMAELLNLDESAKGLFLHNDLPEHLTAVLKSKQRRQKFHDLAKMYANFAAVQDTLPSIDVSQLDDGQVAAYVWLWHSENFRGVGGEAVSLPSSVFFEQKAATITAVTNYFKLPYTQTEIEKIVASPVFQTDAKAVRGGILGRGLRKWGWYLRAERWLPERPFTETQRRGLNNKNSEALHTEIAAGTTWAKAFLADSLTIPNSLISN